LSLGHTHEVQGVRVARLGLQNLSVQRRRLLGIAPAVQLDCTLQLHLHPTVPILPSVVRTRYPSHAE
jgi:hypothetical protein